MPLQCHLNLCIMLEKCCLIYNHITIGLVISNRFVSNLAQILLTSWGIHTTVNLMIFWLLCQHDTIVTQLKICFSMYFWTSGYLRNYKKQYYYEKQVLISLCIAFICCDKINHIVIYNIGNVINGTRPWLYFRQFK
jgi:hypothetical protein